MDDEAALLGGSDSGSGSESSGGSSGDTDADADTPVGKATSGRKVSTAPELTTADLRAAGLRAGPSVLLVPAPAAADDQWGWGRQAAEVGPDEVLAPSSTDEVAAAARVAAAAAARLAEQRREESRLRRGNLGDRTARDKRKRLTGQQARRAKGGRTSSLVATTSPAPTCLESALSPSGESELRRGGKARRARRGGGEGLRLKMGIAAGC